MGRPIKFQLTLSEDQKQGKDKIHRAKVAVVIGEAGSGKTALVSQFALDEIMSKTKTDYGRIVITRPTVDAVDTKNMGALPGEAADKLGPFITPVLDNMYKLYNKEKVDTLFKEGKIVTIPLQFMRGITIDSEILIVDESQNLTESQILLILTRLGKNSKIIFTGDYAQCDFGNKNKSGILKLINVANGLDYMEVVELTTNHRDPIIKDIIKAFNK